MVYRSLIDNPPSRALCTLSFFPGAYRKHCHQKSPPLFSRFDNILALALNMTRKKKNDTYLDLYSKPSPKGSS